MAEEYWPNCDCKLYSKVPRAEKTLNKWREIQNLCNRLRLGQRQRDLEIQSLRQQHQQKKAEGVGTVELLKIMRELKRISQMNIRNYVAEKGSVNSGGGRRRRTRRKRRTRRRRRKRGGRKTRRKRKRRKRRKTRRQ